MPRQERGIFGMKKDRKNPILFSFNVPQGEEMPSDSDDSDYCPDNSDSEGPSSSKNKTKKRKLTKQKPLKDNKAKKSKSGGDVKAENSKTVNSGLEVLLPPEILLKIFQMVVAEEGALPFLNRAQKVCRVWEEVTSHPKLWKKVDLSFGFLKLSQNSFKKLCAHRFSECQQLNLTNCKITSDIAAIKAIAAHCPNLESLNLTRCQKLPADSLKIIADGCKLLQDIDLTATKADTVSSQSLCNLVDKCGSNLRRLILADNNLKGFGVVLNSLMEKCPNLEHLDISSCKLSAILSLDIERMHTVWPKLRSLGLANTDFRAATASRRVQDESPGFKNLEEISLASLDSGSCVTEEVIQRLLKGSENLHLLDLRGCKITQAISCIEDLPIVNLEQLYLSKSAVSTCLNLHSILLKWRHSLTDLDLSWNNFREGILGLALVSLKAGTCDQPSKLTNINLAGTPVTMTMIRGLLSNIPSLLSLDLTSCRDVSRGCKREYKTRKELRQLMDSSG